MKVFLDCILCSLGQAHAISKASGIEKETQEKIMKEALNILCNFDRYNSSPAMFRDVQKIFTKYAGPDPYKKTKKEDIGLALKLYPFLKQYLKQKQQSLYWMLKIAATGNILDAMNFSSTDAQKQITEELEKDFSVCDMDSFENHLKEAKRIVIIGDNAGETVFDRVLTEGLNKKDIIYAVRSAPVINDATIEDAIISGLDKSCRIVSSGCDSPGVILDECSGEFLDLYYGADIVISKGQGNYETLADNAKRDIYFLLKAKCLVLAELLNVKVNDYVFKYKKST